MADLESKCLLLVSRWKERATSDIQPKDYKWAVNECAEELQELINGSLDVYLRDVLASLPSQEVKSYLESQEADNYLSTMEAHGVLC